MEDAPLQAALERLADADILLVQGLPHQSDYLFPQITGLPCIRSASRTAEIIREARPGYDPSARAGARSICTSFAV